MVAVTKIIRFFLDVLLLELWNNFPINGTSPMTGTLSLVLCTWEEINPPITTVWLSQTFTDVTTCRMVKSGRMTGNCTTFKLPVTPGMMGAVSYPLKSVKDGINDMLMVQPSDST